MGGVVGWFESDEDKKDREEFNRIMAESREYGIHHKATSGGSLYIEGDINKHPNIIKARKDLERLFDK